MAYSLRLMLAAFALALITGLVVWRGPQVADVALVAQSPVGEEVAAGAAISMTFSRQVDRLSVERSFRITPALPGRFYWDERTLTFRPGRPFAPATTYQVEIGTGLRDARGRANRTGVGWQFRTRSPRLVLVIGAGAGASTLWLADPAGGVAQQVYSGGELIGTPAVGPDGTRVIVAEERDNERAALLLVELQSGTAAPLIDEPELSATAPVWSVTSDLVAFERRPVVEGGIGSPRIWLAQPDGTSLGPLVGDAGQSGYAPVWSPDGNRLAFLDGANNSVTIYDAFSATARALPDQSLETVSWHPDGATLIYAALRETPDGPRSRIRRAELRDDIYRDLSAGPGDDTSPAFAPDGAFIAFVRQEPGAAGAALWVMRADGSQPRRLTLPEPGQITLPTWSPDSRQIAYVQIAPDGSSSAYVVALDGGAPLPLRQGVTALAWVP